MTRRQQKAQTKQPYVKFRHLSDKQWYLQDWHEQLQQVYALLYGTQSISHCLSHTLMGITQSNMLSLCLPTPIFQALTSINCIRIFVPVVSPQNFLLCIHSGSLDWQSLSLHTANSSQPFISRPNLEASPDSSTLNQVNFDPLFCFSSILQQFIAFY